jgi:aspartyl/glutamyl-tRNA(Asn/Gln) amidotransferase C subunit
MSQEQQDDIDIKTIHHIALLVRLGLTDAEAKAFTPQLRTILDHFKLLAEAEVAPQQAMGTAIGVVREDVVGETLSREAFLAGVPHRSGNFVVAKAVFPSGEQEATHGP